MKPYYENDLGCLYHGDCYDIMNKSRFFADLILTDPPYGINMDKGFGGSRGFGGLGEPIKSQSYKDNWDEKPTRKYFDMMKIISKNQIIFGGNYFTDVLPQNNHWIFWDKLNTMPTFSDGELIWTDFKRNSVKRYIYEYNGLIGKEKERFHPTQKPTGIMIALLNDYSKENDLILDPFAGSGTTGVACHRLQRRYILIEKEEEYCQIIKERLIIEAQKRRLF